MVDCKGEVDSSTDLEGPYIGEEERIRHDALFFSQNPDDSLLLSGERARSLFIKSKLPLQELSKIWKFADVTRDNMLDECEFAVAVHLIQRRLCGFDIPDVIPHERRPKPRPLLIVKQANIDELDAYSTIYDWLSPEEDGILTSETVLRFLGTSDLPAEVLSKIWDLSDIDRDGKINKDEFFIAIHITRFCVNGRSDLTESIDVLSILPKKASGESIQDKRRRRTEFQTDIRKLTSLKEKLQTELSNAETNENEAAIAKIKFELDKTSKELEEVVTKEGNLRKEITQMNLQTSVTTDIEVMRPFDRSFLMKRQSCGVDFLKKLNYKPGQCRFCEDVTPEIFSGENIFDFAKSLPVNPYAKPKRKGSGSPQKESLIENHIEDHSSTAHSNGASDSSDDESDSIEIGIRRRRKNKPKSERNRIANREPVNERRVRSLSEAIKDIAARNEAAKKEMDVRMIEHSGSNMSSEDSSTDSSDAKQGKKKDAHRRRSKGAMELFHKLFSSDSETASDKESPTKRRSVKTLQKSPWNERKGIKLSSSDSEKVGEDKRNAQDQAGPKNFGSRSSENIAPSGGLANDSLISPVEREENAFDFRKTFALMDNLTKTNGESKNSRLVTEFYKTSSESESERLNRKSRIAKEKTVINGGDCDEVAELILQPVVVNGVEESVAFDLDKEEEVNSIVTREARAGERGATVEEETVAPKAVSVEERVKNLIDLLEETSCDTMEEEKFRRRLSQNKKGDISDSNSGQDTPQTGSDNEAAKRSEQRNGIKGSSANRLQESQAKQWLQRSPVSNHGSSSSNTENTSGGDTSDGGEHDKDKPRDGLTNLDGKQNVEEQNNSSPTTKKRRVLKTKSGHVVRSKSMYGLKSSTDPNRLSYVDECEWLDTLVQIELDTIEKRKKAEEEASLAPLVESAPRPQMFSRDETIDEASLNLYDSRHLVKTLLDMEMEGRKSKEEEVKRREGKKPKDKDALERRKSMPVGKDILQAAEERRIHAADFRIDVTPKKDSVADHIANDHEAESRKDGEIKNKDKELVARASSIPKSPVTNSSLIGGNATGRLEKPHSETPPAQHDIAAAQTQSSSERDHTDGPKAERDTKAKSDAVQAHGKKLQRQKSTEDDGKTLKSIKAFKEMFEEKSSIERPVDSYGKSISVDLSPVSLTRSKSLGEGLHRPAEDSKRINVVEKQASVEKKDRGFLRERSRSKDVVFYDEAKKDRERSESLDEEKHGMKSGKAISDTVEVVNAKHPNEDLKADEEEVPHFKNIGKFKELFEQKSPVEEFPTKKHVAVVKKESVKGDAKSKEEEKKEFKEIEKETLTHDLEKHADEKVTEKKEIKQNDASNGLGTGTEPRADVEGQEEHHEESIPSIKSKLALFQASFDQGGVAKREPKIRKVRPKSFHGSTFKEDFDSEDRDLKSNQRSSQENAELTFENSRSKFGTTAESIRDVGEWVMQGTSPSNSKGSSGVAGKQGTKNGPKTPLSKSVSHSAIASSPSTFRRATPNLREKEHSKTNDLQESDERLEAFSYSKVVKDERIRKELEEQEAREREVRCRAPSSSGETSEQKQMESEAGETEAGETEAVHKSNNEQVQEKNGVHGVIGNGTLDYLAYAKSDRIRKEIEEEQRREKEVKQHMIPRTTDSSKKEELKNRLSNDQAQKEHIVNNFKKKESNTLTDSGRQESLSKEKNKPDSNGNFEAKLEHSHGEKTKVSRDSLKSRKMPSRIELELEEERRRERELEEERRKREEERTRILDEEKRKLELAEAEKRRIEEEEHAKQNAVQEEKIKRQAKTRGLRALFETS